MPENLVITWPYSDRRPSVPTTGKPMFILSLWEPKRKLIAYQCCDQLAAVKTGHQLTSITWPYLGVKCRPIEVEDFLKLSADKLPVSNDRRLTFIFSNDSYQICCVYVTLTHTIRILIANWPRTQKFSQLFKNTGREDLFLPWSRVSHALRPILCSDWSKFDRWVHEENLCSILKLVYW